MNTKRRDFIKQSMVGSGAMAIGGMGFSSKSYGNIKGANDRIFLAVIGIRNQGTVHISNYCRLSASHNVRIKTICDTDELLFDRAAKTILDKTGVKPLTEWDMRRVFEDPEINAVSIATPNHWHALATVWACQAGKHVFVEKPCSHNIWEGRKMIEAARKYDRRVQVGFVNRTSGTVMDAIKSLHEGLIGDIYMARALCYKPRDSFGIARDTTPPATFHYDQWLGPAPYRPYNVKRSHYCWHWYWDTGNGDTGNTGPHQLDLARWGLKKNVHPVSVFSDGGLFGFHQDDKTLETSTPGNMVYGDVETYGMDKTSQETPNTQTATFKYEDGKLLEFEARGRFTNHEGSDGNEASNLYYGTEGWMEITGRTWRAFRNREKEAFATYDAKGIRGEGNLWSNFLDAVRSGKDETLRCGIDEGHLSSALPHLANISYRVGRSLKFMAGKEQFVNDPEANGFLSRDYRKPFVVPAIV